MTPKPKNKLNKKGEVVLIRNCIVSFYQKTAWLAIGLEPLGIKNLSFETKAIEIG
jgi:hypothetical protein